MKKTLIIIFTISVNFFAQAQKDSHEVTIDLGDALIMKSLELNYEYYLGSQSAIGMSMLFNFQKESSDIRYNEKTMFMPYFHHYFSENTNWNYFGEVFTGINSGKSKKGEDYTDLALGVSGGLKYVSNGGLVATVIAGIGRNMFTDESPLIVPRINVNLGYRF